MSAATRRLCELGVLGGKNAFVSSFPRGPRVPRGELFSLGGRREPAGLGPPLQRQSVFIGGSFFLRVLVSLWFGLLEDLRKK